MAAELHPEVQTCLVLFTDVVNSTQMSASAGDAQARVFWSKHDRMARDLIRATGGTEVGRSDGFLVVFRNALDGLAFAAGYHRLLEGTGSGIKARIGAHWGPVEVFCNSESDVAAGATRFDIDGLAVPTAARVMSAAQGGQTLFTAAAIEAVRSNPEGVDLLDCGFWRLKGLPEPVGLTEIFFPGCSMGPPEDSEKAYRVAWVDGEWVPCRGLPGNVGPDADEFVGRSADLVALDREFNSKSRLITIVGPGGVGKTRLARRFARGWRGEFPGGVWFCDLSSARSREGVAYAVAQALEVPLGRRDPVEVLSAALDQRGPCLVLLDNFEQLVEWAPSTLGVWLQGAPRARFLVTSREVLGLRGERVHELLQLSSTEAQHLYRQRVQAAGGSLAGDVEGLSRLVELLDFLPLAIELAAARAAVLTPKQQLERIGERFRLLATRGPHLDRHSTLRATIDWSWELLGASERQALAQLSVFEGGFDLAAAEAVLDVSAGESQCWSVDVLQRLVSKSLVRRVSPSRWTLLRSIQDYAAEMLRGSEAGCHTRHWRYFGHLSESEAVKQRVIDLENLVMACKRASSAGAAAGDAAILQEACLVLTNAWAGLRLAGLFGIGRELAHALLASPHLPPIGKAQALRVAGASAAALGDQVMALQLNEEALAEAHRAQDPRLCAFLSATLADLAVQMGQYSRAETWAQSGLQLAGVASAPRIAALNALGGLALARSKPLEARDHYEMALKLAEAHHEERWAGGIHGSLGVTLIALGEAAAARPHLDAAIEISEAMGDRQWSNFARCNLGLLLQTVGAHEEAREQLLKVAKAAREMAQTRLLATTLCNLGVVELSLDHANAAESVLREALQLAGTLRAERLYIQCGAYLAQALVSNCAAPAALTLLEEIQGWNVSDLDDSLKVLLLSQRALALSELGEHTAAQECILVAAGLSSGSHSVDSEAHAVLNSVQSRVNRR